MTKMPVPRDGSDSPHYGSILADVADLSGQATRTAVRAVNAWMTALYWPIGCRIVESEPAGKIRAGHGSGLLKRLPTDLTERFGRGFSVDNLESMTAFYFAYHTERISETLSRESSAAGEAPGKPAQFPWHKVTTVHYLDVDTMTHPTRVREDSPPYGGRE